MIILSKEDSQIVLYAKNHFGYGSDIEDIRTLIASRSGVLPKNVSDRDIVFVLMDLLNTLKLRVSTNFICAVIFGTYFLGDQQNAFRNFVMTALELMHLMPVLDDNDNVLVHLEPVDLSLLPKKT